MQYWYYGCPLRFGWELLLIVLLLLLLLPPCVIVVALQPLAIAELVTRSAEEMMLIVAEVAGLDASGISAVRSPPATSLPRDTQRLSQRDWGIEVSDLSLRRLRRGWTAPV